MVKLIRKHQKKVLAFFGVALMIAFAASSNTGRGPNGPERKEIGKWNGGTIYSTELADSHREWAALKTYVQISFPNQLTRRYEMRPIIYAYLPSSAIAEIEQKP